MSVSTALFVQAGEASSVTQLSIQDFDDLMTSAAQNPTIACAEKGDHPLHGFLRTPPGVLTGASHRPYVPPGPKEKGRRQGKRRREPEQAFLSNIKVE